jgi:hypothetical protein
VSPGDARLEDVLLQHDFDSQVIFHHRTGAKWTAWGRNLHVFGFAHEAVCLEALRELRGLWDGRVDLEQAIAAAPEAEAELLRVRYFLYRLLGSGERVLELLPGGRIGGDRTEWEQTWRVDDQHESHTLMIEGRIGITCKLTRDPDGAWRGHWIHQQQTPVELWPLSGNGMGPHASAQEGSAAPGGTR